MKDITPRERRSSSMLEDVSYSTSCLSTSTWYLRHVRHCQQCRDSKEELLHGVAGFAFASRERARRAEIRTKQQKAAMDAADDDDEEEEDDGGAHGGSGGKTSVSGAFFTLFKSFVGLGVLALPLLRDKQDMYSSR